MLGLIVFHARLVEAKTFVPAGADPAVPIRTTGRRCAHCARSDVSNTVFSCGSLGKPIGDICEERLPAADRSDPRRRAGRTFRLDAQSGAGSAAIGCTAARANFECTAARAGRETRSTSSLQTLLAHFRANGAAARGTTLAAAAAIMNDFSSDNAISRH